VKFGQFGKKLVQVGPKTAVDFAYLTVFKQISVFLAENKITENFVVLKTIKFLLFSSSVSPICVDYK
jgi:hypothetical protein